MAKVSIVLLLVALVAYVQVSEAYLTSNVDEQEVLENDIQKAKDLIGEAIKEKQGTIKDLENVVTLLTKSEMMLTQLGEAYKNGKNLKPYGKKLTKFNTRIKRAPEEVKYVSIIQSILQDLGLNKSKY
ncbi:unnamed protein product [Cochlearia groenlandica]